MSETRSNMIFLEWLLMISLMFVSAKSIFADKIVNNILDTVNANTDLDNITTDFYLTKNITLTHYNIILTISPQTKNYFGESNISISIHQDIYIIELHSANVIFPTPVLSKKNDTYSPTFVRVSRNVCALYFYEGLSRGNYILSLKFLGFFDAEGLFKTSYKVEEYEWLYATQSSVNGARYVFPCLDESLRATFDVTINYPLNHMILSNTPAKYVRFIDKLVQARFNTTPAIPPYLVGFVMHDYRNFSIVGNFRYRSFSAPHAKFLKMVADNVTTLYNDTHERNQRSERISVPRVYHILIPGLRDESIQKWRLIFYREEDVLFDSRIDTFARKVQIVRLISYALVHQWYCNRVSPILRSYLWLNEGIASLLGAKIGNEAYPMLPMTDLLVVQMRQESLRLDIDSFMQPLVSESAFGINSSFSFSYYIKAPVILRMLQHIITDDVFQKGIDVYFEKYDLKSTSLNDFLSVMRNVCLEAQVSFTINCNLTNIMDDWITKAHYPVLNVTRHNCTQIKVSVEYPSNLKSWIPLTVTTEAKLNFSIPTSLHSNPYWIKEIMLNPGITDYYVPVKENNWVIVNLQQIGYYRVNYENENWIKLSTYLKSESYDKIHILNRAQLIDDAFYFLMKGQLALNTFMDFIQYLTHETNFIVWYPMFKVLEQMSGFFPFKESFDIKEKIWTLIDKLLKTNEIFKHNDLVGCLRHELIIWSCQLGSSDCRKKATHQLTLHLTSDLPIWPGWKEWTYCAGLMEADVALWHTIFYADKQNNKKFLACSKNSDTIIHYIELITTKFHGNQIKSRDHVNSFHSIIMRHARNDRVLEHILTNFIKIKPRNINTFVALTNIINYAYSNDQLVKVRNFLENDLRSNKNLTITIFHEYFKIDIPFKEVKGLTTYIVEFDQLILFLERKLQTRSSQIMRLKKEFSNIEFLEPQNTRLVNLPDQ